MSLKDRCKDLVRQFGEEARIDASTLRNTYTEAKIRYK